MYDKTIEIKLPGFFLMCLCDDVILMKKNHITNQLWYLKQMQTRKLQCIPYKAADCDQCMPWLGEQTYQNVHRNPSFLRVILGQATAVQQSETWRGRMAARAFTGNWKRALSGDIINSLTTYRICFTDQTRLLCAPD